MGLRIQRRVTKKARMIATLIAVFALAAQPMYGFVSSQVANAASADTAEIRSEADLVAAAGNSTIKNLSIKQSITTTQKIVLSGRSMNIDGNGNSITMLNANTNGWHGEYVLQAYKISLSVKNIAITGGDAAIYANGSSVLLQGAVNVSGNEFGGIEVSQGANVTTPAILNATTANVVNRSEANGLPTVWTDKSDTANAAVNGAFSLATHIKANQKQYYLNSVNTGTVATNVTQQRTYTDLTAAVSAANAGDTIQLNQDITLNTMVFLDKPLTLDGNGKTLTANYSYTTNGVNNAVLTVTSNNVTVKNITTDNTSTAAKPHGIVVQTVTGVNLNNVTLNNGRAGLIVNGSVVNVNGIHTSGNSWYGINVDKAGARMNIQGANSHTETNHIVVDNKASGAFVVDLFGKYEKTTTGNVITYVLDTTVPSIASVTFGATALEGRYIKGTQVVKAVLTDGQNTALNFTNFELRKDGAFKAQWSGGSSLTPSFNFDTTAYVAGSYTLRVYGRDNAGNTYTKDLGFTIDNDAPVITTGVVNQSTVAGSNVVLDMTTASEANPNIVNIRVLDSNGDVAKNKNGIDVTGLYKQNYTLNTASYIWDTTKMNDGVYKIQFSAKDAAGNSATPVFRTVTVHNTQPDSVLNADNFNTHGGADYKGLNVGFNIDNFQTVSHVSVALYKDGATLPFVTNTENANLLGLINDGGVKGLSTPFIIQPGTYTEEYWTLGNYVWAAGDSAPARALVTVTGVDLNGNSVSKEVTLTMLANQAATPFASLLPAAVVPVVPSNPTTPSFATPGITNRGTPVANPARLLAGNALVATPVAPAQTVADTAVLGAQDVKDDTGILGASKDVAAITPSADGWKIFGFAWYLWALLIAAVAAIWWWIAAARRRSQDA